MSYWQDFKRCEGLALILYKLELIYPPPFTMCEGDGDDEAKYIIGKEIQGSFSVTKQR